nr:40s ribosomal protein s27-2 [Quercus suber]
MQLHSMIIAFDTLTVELTNGRRDTSPFWVGQHFKYEKKVKGQDQQYCEYGSFHCFSSSLLKSSSKMVLQNDIDLLNPPAELEKRKHKLKRLVQSPNSFFMDVKCQGCFNITTVFSHSQTVVVCALFFPLHNHDIRMVSLGDSGIEIGASFCFAYDIFVLLVLLALCKF